MTQRLKRRQGQQPSAESRPAASPAASLSLPLTALRSWDAEAPRASAFSPLHCIKGLQPGNIIILNPRWAFASLPKDGARQALVLHSLTELLGRPRLMHAQYRKRG